MTKPPGVLIWFSVTLHLVRGGREMGKHTFISLSANCDIFLCNLLLEGEGLGSLPRGEYLCFGACCQLGLQLCSKERIFPHVMACSGPKKLPAVRYHTLSQKLISSLSSRFYSMSKEEWKRNSRKFMENGIETWFLLVWIWNPYIVSYTILLAYTCWIHTTPVLNERCDYGPLFDGGTAILWWHWYPSNLALLKQLNKQFLKCFAIRIRILFLDVKSSWEVTLKQLDSEIIFRWN